MANNLERFLPPKIRLRLKNVVANAIGLFLALRYNDYLRKVIAAFIPDGNNLLLEGLFLIVLTLTVVFLVQWFEKVLDSK